MVAVCKYASLLWQFMCHMTFATFHDETSKKLARSVQDKVSEYSFIFVDERP